MGAIASGGVRALNDYVVRQLNIPPAAIEAVAEREAVEIRRRERLYRGEKPPINVAGKIIILVDDGLATGATMKAAVLALRGQNPAKITVAVPAAPPETCDELRNDADEVICAHTPDHFYAVGQWYEDFPQTTDDEVRDLISRAA